jgi:carbon-monoxide dehydrogenase medium subunit
VKSAPFHYSRPDSVAEALRLLVDIPGAHVLAGGQSLLPLMNFRQVEPHHLIDINRLGQLDYVRDLGAQIAIGALTRQRTVEFSVLVADRLPLVRAAVRRLGHRQTRNRGTVGGSLCHMDPAAELALMACIHDGQLLLRRHGGERTVAMSDFAQGAHATARESDELLTELRLTPWPAGHGYGFHEFSRRHADWAIASAAALMLLDADGRIERVAVALGAVEDVARRRPGVEARLGGQRPSEALFAAATSGADDLVARDDVAAPAWYRSHLAGVLTRRALRDAARARLPEMS